MTIKRCVGNALLIGVSTLCGLGLAELGVRAFYPQQLGVWYSLRNGMVIHPPGARIYLANFGQEVSFNSLGMRDIERPVAKDPGVFRILVLGDSFMEALQVPLESSFTRLLEERLRVATGRRVEVMSGSVSGWGTDDQLEYLRRYGLALRPDLVLVGMTLHNDVFDNLRERFHTLSEGRVVARPPDEMPPGEFALLKVKDYLASRSHLTQLLRKFRARHEITDSAQRLDTHVLQLLRRERSPAMAKGWRLTEALFQQMQEEARNVGAQTAVFLIPLTVQLYDETLRRWIAASGVSLDELALEGPQQAMLDFGARTRLDTIDLLPTFRSAAGGRHRALHLPSDGHWNAEGHRLAAAVVAEELKRRHLLGDYVGTARR